MSEISEKFIILKKIKYGEADLIIQALTMTGAKKSFMARSALKSKKRFGGGILEPSHFVLLTYKNTAKENQMYTLSEAILIDDFKEIHTDFDKLDFGLFVLNCAYHVSQEGDLDSHFLFNLVGHTLRNLGSTQNLNRYKLHFYLKFLFQQGVISVDAWMAPFLKTNMNESHQLDQLENLAELVEEMEPSFDSQVRHYIKNADTGF